MSTRQGQEEVIKLGSKCEDCGNQAKKDCAYSRCRTCCKNKGFQCQTHIRSTWVPVDRRRHRMDQNPPTTTNLQGDFPKRHRHQNPYSRIGELKFPAVMNSMALFSCVCVRSMDNTVNEIAYQTSVNIGGHVFSGLLYDQGPDQQSSFNNASPQQQHNLRLSSGSINIRDGATMHLLSAAAAATTTSAAHELFLPPLHPFRSGI